MKQTLVDLVEAVRDLGLVITDKPTPNCVRVELSPNDFWTKMKMVQIALEAFDRDGGIGVDVETPQPKDNPENLKIALDGLMRLYQLKGGSLEEATEVIQSALGLVEEKKEDSRSTYEILPNFAPEKMKRRRGFKPRLSLVPEKHASVSFNTLRRMNFEVLDTHRLLGATFRPERPRDHSLSSELAAKL